MRGNFQLCPRDVQEIRVMHRHGFTHRTIAETYGVALITIQDIVQGRSWRHLPPQEVPLPTLQPEVATQLRLRSWGRLSKEMKRALDEYRRQLTAHIETSAESEALAITLLNEWRPKRPKRKREAQVAALA